MLGLAAILLLAPQPLHMAAAALLSQQPFELVTEGVATYYTTRSSGTHTASGERLRDDELTCAMRLGEFGTYYLVVAETGTAVVCRLNDRGPFIKGRVIDLSLAAMRSLQPYAGKAKVRVYELGNPDNLGKLKLEGAASFLNGEGLAKRFSFAEGKLLLKSSAAEAGAESAAEDS